MDQEFSDLKGLQHFKSDDVLKEFMSTSFNVQSYTTTVIQSTNITNRLAELEQGINVLDKELQTQITKRHGDLLAQATGIESLEGVLTMMQSRIVSIQSAVDRIRNKVGEPYKKIQARTSQLDRLQNTCDVLRRIIRLQRISKRLTIQLQSGIKEITKSAQSIRELEHLSQGIDLHGIDIFDDNQKFFSQAKKEVQIKSGQLLRQALRSQNQTQTGTALQAFYNLELLCEAVRKIKEESIEKLKECVEVALSSKNIQASLNNSTTYGKGPGKISGYPSASSAVYRQNLWNNLDILADQILTIFIELFHLQKVLLKKRDPVSHIIFAEKVKKNTDDNFIQVVWKKVCGFLGENFNTTGLTRNLLEEEFPKLLCLFIELWSKVEPHETLLDTYEDKIKKSFNEGTSKSVADEKLKFNARDLLMMSLEELESVYIRKCYSRLCDPINLLFSSSTRNKIPSVQDLAGVLKIIRSELSISLVDNKLAISVAKSIGKAVQMYVNQCEQRLETQEDSRQVIASPTNAQIKNVNILNSLCDLQNGLNTILEQQQLPSKVKSLLQQSIERVLQLKLAIARPIIQSASECAEAILMTMHDDDFSDNKSDEKIISSMYIQELRDFVNRVVKNHLGQIVDNTFVLMVSQPLGYRCIEIFIRHASLVRPIGEIGKLKLSADLNELEQTLLPLCSRLTDFGISYRKLRSFKSLLFQSNESVSNCNNLGKTVDYSTAIQIILSRSPQDIRSPHQVMGWSIHYYNEWLDKHQNETARLNILRGCIENHVNFVRSTNKDSFVPSYTILVKLIKNAFASLS